MCATILAVRAFACPVCNAFVAFEAEQCANCQGPAGIHLPSRSMLPVVESYDDVPIERMLFDWHWMSLFFNRINTAMGKNPLYPFEIPPAVVAKLGFIHRVIRKSAQQGVEH
jgi:hypothetical protein